MNKSYFITLGFICVLLSIAVFVTYKVSSIPKDDRNAPATKNLATTDTQIFTDIEGNQIDLENYVGKVRIVISWASWCPSCLQDLQNLDSLVQQYQNTNLVVLAIDRKEPKDQIDRYLNTFGKLSHIIYVVDINDTFYKSVGGYAMPEFVFYNAQGNEVLHEHGDMNQEQIRAVLDTMIPTKS